MHQIFVDGVHLVLAFKPDGRETDAVHAAYQDTLADKCLLVASQESARPYHVVNSWRALSVDNQIGARGDGS